MANIKDIYEDAARTTPFYPRTHEKAVIDNNGTTLNSKLGVITDLVNQAQMEIGAVPSDLTPTENSSGWVTSSGVFAETTIFEEINITQYPTLPCAIVVSTLKWSTSNIDTKNKHILVPVNVGENYKVVKNADQVLNYAWLTSAEVSSGANAPVVSGTTTYDNSSENGIILTPPTGAVYMYIRTNFDSTTAQYPSFFGKVKKVKDASTFLSGEVVGETKVSNSVTSVGKELVTGKAVFSALNSLMVDSSLDVSANLDSDRQDRWVDVQNFSQSTTGKHVALSVPSNATSITVLGHSSRGSYIAFVKSYEVPTYAAVFDFCDGYTARTQVASNTSSTLAIPDGCKYVIVGIANDNSTSYKPQSVIFRTRTIGLSTDFVNDIYVNSLRTSLEDANITAEEYWGDKINVNPVVKKHYYLHYGIDITGIGGYTPSGGTKKSQQGLAIYDKYAFVTYDYGYIRIVDLETKSIVATYAMPEGVFGSQNHAGNANFCDVFYDESDTFPLLYVSSYLENKCYVLRVTLESCSLVQTIYVSDDGSATPNTGTWHFYPDNDGRIIVHGSYGYALGALPSPSVVTAYVNLQQCEILRNVVPSGYTSAGVAALNGNLYILAYTSNPRYYSTLFVYNYEQKRLKNKMLFPSNIYSHEFEGIGFYNGDIIVGYNNWDKFMGYKF